MSTRTCKIGIHGRNAPDYEEGDFEVIREARFEVIKMMSETRPEVFDRIRRENPGIEFITRLRGEGFNTGGHPSPNDFVAAMSPIVARLQPYCSKFHIHNEPNHWERKEGWGPNDDDARNFNDWFIQVYRQLKAAHPWASLGFPGLALGPAHRYDPWARICGPAIEQSDWLGVHCYWQTPTNTMLHEGGGLVIKFFHWLYPNKAIEILECGNSDADNGYAISDEDKSNQYVAWLQEIFNHPYVNSACFYILSSPDRDRKWEFFTWRTQENHKKSEVWRVKDMHRPQYQPVQIGAPKPSKPQPPRPVTPPEPMPAGLTNQMVLNAFCYAAQKLGMENWSLLRASAAGLDENELVNRGRGVLYTGPRLDQMPGLTDEQRRLVRAQLPDDVSFGPPAWDDLLVRWPDLLRAPLTMPRGLHVRSGQAAGRLERRLARVWNRYGYLLTMVADGLGVEPSLAAALVALDATRPAFGRDGRLTLRFEPGVFYERWGREHGESFSRHFQLESARPWRGHRFRIDEGGEWQDVHASHFQEWAALDLARSLDRPAANASTALGMFALPAASHGLLGYESAGQMVDAFSCGERYQLLGYFDFLSAYPSGSRRLQALQQGDYETFSALHAGSRNAARYTAMIHQAVAMLAGLGS